MSKKNNNKIHGRLWITSNGENFAGQGRIELLKNIKETGSISAAAKTMKMSYKSAWDSVEAMNTLSDKPLVERVSGGKHGGGTVLTPEGENIIAAYDRYKNMLNQLILFMDEHPEVNIMIDKMSFKSSADNSFFGTVTRIERGAVSAIVEIDSEGLLITSSITVSSLDRLALSEGSTVCALISSNQFVVMLKNNDVVASARNQFPCKVLSVKKGAVNSEIEMKTENGVAINAMISNESAEKMDIRYDTEVIVLCKASSVMIVA